MIQGCIKTASVSEVFLGLERLCLCSTLYLVRNSVLLLIRESKGLVEANKVFILEFSITNLR
jgi:hypothetical protein